MPESQNTEWKQSWKDDYLKWVVGFANAQGGRIYLGMDDEGKVVGLHRHRALLEEIPNKIRSLLGIVCEVNHHEDAGKAYLEIVVPPYSVPVSLRGRYYYRSGSTKTELVGQALNDFLLKKAGLTWDEVTEPAATWDDIDEPSVQTFLKDAAQSGRMPTTENLSVPEVLHKLRLTQGDSLKRAAIVLFGKDPRRFYPSLYVKVGRFGVDEAPRYHEDLSGNLIQLFRQVPEILDLKFLRRNIRFEGYRRFEELEYPIEALREMLLNALAHRQYQGAHIQLRVYDDFLQIWNEGTLPDEVPLASLNRTHMSRPRNPLISDVLFRAGYIDLWGYGTLKIFKACEAAGLPAPEIEEVFGGVLVKLRSGGQMGGAIGGTMGGTIGGAISLTEREQEIVNLIRKDTSATYRGIADQLGINVSAVQKHIEKLKEKGILERIGGTRGHWQINLP